MKKAYLLVICLMALVFSSQAQNGEYFGEEFTVSEPININDVRQKMEEKGSVDVQIMGTVQSVCKKKGCWTNISDASTPDNTIFVKFKDYGFFLPLDCEGQEVVMQGKAYIEETSVDELRHYAEDEGKSKEEIEKITEPAKEYKFMASGVYLKPKAE